MSCEGIGPLVRQTAHTLNAARQAENPDSQAPARAGGEKPAPTAFGNTVQVSDSALARFAEWQARHEISRPGAAPLPTRTPASEVEPPITERTYRPLPRQTPPPGEV